MTTESTVTLRARTGQPLAREDVERTVIATAHAIAERQGVELRSVEHTGDSITLVVAGPEIVAVGFAAELRRVTEHWHAGRGDGSLWGEADHFS